eukprot:scaffold633_cov288-Ochromonas_danica.AAC.81
MKKKREENQSESGEEEGYLGHSIKRLRLAERDGEAALPLPPPLPATDPPQPTSQDDLQQMNMLLRTLHFLRLARKEQKSQVR